MTTALTPTALTPMFRAFKYLRVSDPTQAAADRNSLETQDVRLDAYAEERGYRVAGSFVDVFTGKRDDRKSYQSMLARLRNREADVVIVRWLDRFGRNPREILTRYWELEQRGIRIEASDEDVSEEIVLLVKAGLAGKESQKIAERVKANMPRAIEKGIRPGSRPFGYRTDNEYAQYADPKGNIRHRLIQHWRQDPDEVAIVRRMYKLAVGRNLGYRPIAEALNREGSRARLGGLWTPGAVSIILNNEGLAGVYTYMGKRYEGFFPAILSAVEWAALKQRQEIRRGAKGKSHVSEYLLSGTAKCGHCGGPMTGTAHTSDGKVYRYYECSRARKSKALCESRKMHLARRLEEAVLEHLGQFIVPNKVRELLAQDKSSSLAMLEAEQVMAQARVKTLEEDFLQNLAMLKKGVISEDEFRTANEARREERKAAEARLGELTGRLEAGRAADAGVEALPGRVGGFLEDVRNLSVQENKSRLQSLLSAIHVYADGRVEVGFRGCGG